jgi:WD40 repeat protein
LRKGDTRPGLLRLAAPVVALSYLDQGRRLLSGQVDARGGRSVLQVHDCTKSRELAALHVAELFSALAVSSDHKLLAAGKSDGTLSVFDLHAALGELTEPAPARDLRPTRSLMGHRKAVTSIAFLPGGARAVSAAMEPKVILWDLDSGERTTTFRGARNEVFASVAVTRGGAMIAACLADGRIRLWEAV